MEAFDQKINRYFPGLVVRKDLVKAVKGNAIVPTYVLEYLLGQYCATDDDATIQQGIESVRNILATHYVHRSEAGLVRSRIKERGRFKVLVDLNTIKAHPRLLVSGVWCIADVEYSYTEDKNSSPWILASLKPIQLSSFDFEGYIEARKQFSTDEWVNLLIQSMGFNPALFGRRSKLTMLVRLVPFCERNYNIIELGPKGTGKSHIYSEFSPHGILISGGEVTVPKLFVNNSSGKIGLVGYWDCIAFDEFAGRQKSVNKALVDIMKNYMANKSFSRGVETLGAEASMAFVGNTTHNVPYMLKHTDLFFDLPEKFYDSAFLDRLHFYVPGWEVDIIRGEMFSQGYGFVVDYLAEILSYLRNQDYSDRYKKNFTLSKDIATRDRDGINKTFSGLMNYSILLVTLSSKKWRKCCASPLRDVSVSKINSYGLIPPMTQCVSPTRTTRVARKRLSQHWKKMNTLDITINVQNRAMLLIVTMSLSHGEPLIHSTKSRRMP